MRAITEAGHVDEIMRRLSGTLEEAQAVRLRALSMRVGVAGSPVGRVSRGGWGYCGEGD